MKMNLEQIAKQDKINPNSLNAKDDALKVAVLSIQDLVKQMQSKNGDPTTIEQIRKLGEFLHECSNCTMH